MEAGPALDMSILEDDLCQLAHVMAPQYAGVPLSFSYDTDRQLQCVFGFTVPLESPGSLEAQRNYMQVGCMQVGHMEFLRRLNAYNAELWVKGPNKNRISIAFSIERNSGMHTGDPATAFDGLADRPHGARGAQI